MMRAGAATRTAAWDIRRLFLLATLLAFFLQNFAVQTHVHPFAQAPNQAQASSIPLLPPSNLLDSADAASCRLCQELAHAGATLSPVILSLLTLLAFVLTASAYAQLPARAIRPPFNWQSRAPPRR